ECQRRIAGRYGFGLRSFALLSMTRSSGEDTSKNQNCRPAIRNSHSFLCAVLCPREILALAHLGPNILHRPPVSSSCTPASLPLLLSRPLIRTRGPARFWSIRDIPAGRSHWAALLTIPPPEVPPA